VEIRPPRPSPVARLDYPACCAEVSEIAPDGLGVSRVAENPLLQPCLLAKPIRVCAKCRTRKTVFLKVFGPVFFVDPQIYPCPPFRFALSAGFLLEKTHCSRARFSAPAFAVFATRGPPPFKLMTTCRQPGKFPAAQQEGRVSSKFLEQQIEDAKTKRMRRNTRAIGPYGSEYLGPARRPPSTKPANTAPSSTASPQQGKASDLYRACSCAPKAEAENGYFTGDTTPSSRAAQFFPTGNIFVSKQPADAKGD